MIKLRGEERGEEKEGDLKSSLYKEKFPFSFLLVPEKSCLVSGGEWNKEIGETSDKERKWEREKD